MSHEPEERVRELVCSRKTTLNAVLFGTCSSLTLNSSNIALADRSSNSRCSSTMTVDSSIPEHGAPGAYHRSYDTTTHRFTELRACFGHSDSRFVLFCLALRYRAGAAHRAEAIAEGRGAI